jgi:hypothetical protein
MNKTLSLYIAMILAGIAGYFVLWFSVRQLDPLDYAIFATYWSALYFMVGSLAGFQQEVTRASKPTPTHALGAEKSYRGSSFKLAAYASGGVIAVGLIALGISAISGVGASQQPLSRSIIPITIALAGYVVVAVIAGSLYGLSKWLLLALMVLGDAVLRLIFVVWVLNTNADVDALMWAASIPFGLTIFLLWPWLRKTLRGNVTTDVSLARLWRNSLKAVLAAVGMSLIVSGFPLILSLSSASTSVEVVSQAMFIVTLARAPFVIVAISLQSLLLVRIKSASNPISFMSRLGLVFLGIAAMMIPIGLVISELLLELLVGSPSLLSPWLLTTIVLSGILLAYLVITGVAVLARSQHVRYASGWAVAALLTVVLLVLPIEFELRVMCALLIPPAAGIVIHLSGLRKKKLLC